MNECTAVHAVVDRVLLMFRPSLHECVVVTHMSTSLQCLSVVALLKVNE